MNVPHKDQYWKGRDFNMSDLYHFPGRVWGRMFGQGQDWSFTDPTTGMSQKGKFKMNEEEWTYSLGMIEQFFTKIENFGETAANSMNNAFDRAFDGIVDGTEKFSKIMRDMFNQVVHDIIKELMRVHVIYPFIQTLTGVNLGGSGIEPPEEVDAVIDSGMGGGFTGNAPRTGGLDGHGGFLAMLHPQETIIDHHRGGRTGGATVIVNNSYDFSNADDGTVSRLQAAIPQIVEASTNNVKQELARGGDLYRFVNGGR